MNRPGKFPRRHSTPRRRLQQRAARPAIEQLETRALLTASVVDLDPQNDVFDPGEPDAVWVSPVTVTTQPGDESIAESGPPTSWFGGNPVVLSSPTTSALKDPAPPPPTVGLDAASDTGASGDMRTRVTRPWLVGTSAPGTTVQVIRDGVVMGVATTSASGTWRLRISTPLPAGGLIRFSDIRAVATDRFGTVSETTTTTLVTDTRSFAKLFKESCSGIARSSAERAYARKAFEGYLWGASFAWLYTRQQRQAYGAAGPRGVGAPLNAMYAETAVSPESTGRIGPDVDVTYGEGWLKVLPGKPVVVHFPAPNEVGGHFMMMQVANSSSETIASFSTFPQSPGASSIPQGGDILFHAVGDTTPYPGDFVHRLAVNTDVVFATGRVLTGVGLPADNPFSETRSADLAARFVAAEYSAYVGNGLSMAGLTNSTTTVSDEATRAQLVRYSKSLKGLHFWKMFGEALAQSPLPTTGLGSEPDWQQRTPAEYLATFAPLGLSAAGWSAAGLSRRQIAILGKVATRAHKLLTNFVQKVADHPGTAWSSVPSDLGAYPNNPLGYFERDVAHVANLPAFAVYPTLSRDSDGHLFKGRNTYVMVLPAASLPSTPPLASGGSANKDGFWSFNVYDGNFNVTPSLPGYLDAVARLRPSAAPTISNPNNAGGVPNISFSSLQTPGSLGSEVRKQYRVESNGDVILILSPTRPRDSRYWNNWVPTPLVTYDNPTLPNGSGRFVRDDQFSAMLRVYTPSIYNSEAQAKLLSTAEPGPKQWIIPKIHKAPGLAASERIDADLVRRATERGS